jgi:hypothetical protein
MLFYTEIEFHHFCQRIYRADEVIFARVEQYNDTKPAETETQSKMQED